MPTDVASSIPAWSAALFGDYGGLPGSYDELLDPKGQPRPAWQRFGDATGQLDRDEFGRRWLQAQRLLQQNSLAYPDPRDPHARKHPWELDAFPLVIGADEWASVTGSLKQRALLLEAVLADLWGPQRLLVDRLLPPELLFRHPGFSLALVGSRPPSARRWIDFYGADLARSPDGTWWVMADRTEAPSGAGFALENRLAMSRMLPDVIRQCRVERLAPYFITLQERLAEMVPQPTSNPRVVLLSQSAGSPNFFEDAFLARYLGYTLAEAGDLAVRMNRVYLKTLGGLVPVDVVLRRPDSMQCDPLELATGATSGISGVLQSVRANQVAFANPLGSGLVESAAFMAFMPSLCKHILGEPLLMPGVATWWCGTDEGREMVLKRLDQLIVKPAYRRRANMAVETRRLQKLDKKELAERIKAEPWNFVGQERVNRSTAPTWNNGDVGPAYIALRAFAVADGDNYRVMRGGLARVSTTLDPLELSLLDGERSKDTWVLARGAVAPITLLPAGDDSIELRRTGADLPSRVAENLYWLGRLTERSEALARLLRIVSGRLVSDEDVDRIPELPMLLRLLAEHGQIEPGFVVAEIRPQLPAIEKLLPKVVFDDLQPGALRATVSRVTSLASSVRDRLSLDTWRVLRQMDEEFWPHSETADLTDMQERLGELLLSLAAFTGLVVESMTRTPAWRFLDLGRRIERAAQTTTLLASLLAADKVPVHATLEAALEAADSLMTYRSRYLTRLQLAPVIDLLLTDETNPRSIAFGLSACQQYTRQLNDDTPDLVGDVEQVSIDSLLALVKRSDAVELSRGFARGRQEYLREVLAKLERNLPEFSNILSHKYFIHAGPLQRMTEVDSGA